MSDGNLFKRDLKDYKYTMDVVGNYSEQLRKYISNKFGYSNEDSRSILREVVSSSKPVDPMVTFNHRDSSGDMHVDDIPLTKYIKDVKDSNEVLVPSFTAYTHPSSTKSLHAEFLGINIAKRKVEKKEAFKAKQLGDNDKYIYFNTLQKTRKIFNNSLSGSYASKSTILYNPTAHYTLTSMTRAVASIGNSVSESIVAGNKQLKDSEAMMNLVVATVASIDTVKVGIVMERYGLHVPSSDEVMDMLLYSSRKYFKDESKESIVKEYLDSCSGIELAAVMYTNDLYHTRKYNDKFIRKFIGDMSLRMTGGSSEPVKVIQGMDEDILNLVHHICASDIAGKNIVYGTLKNNEDTMFDVWYSEYVKNCEDKGLDIMERSDYDKEHYVIVDAIASTALHVRDSLRKYKMLIEVFYNSDVLPIGIVHIREMLRDVITLSDTDSTTSAYDEWVEWYFGKVYVSDETIALAASIMFINTQLIDHNIKVFARNMNIEDKLMGLLAMKNEFFWISFTVANVSKHYYASTYIQEGNVYADIDLEIKGVHLISSAGYQDIVKAAHGMMDEINHKLLKNETIDVVEYIERVVSYEKYMLDKLNSGNINVFKSDKIKEAEAYKLDDKSKTPYIHHVLWEEVFKSTYGDAGLPTYNVIKIPTKLTSKKKLADYVASIENDTIRENLSKFLVKYKKEALGTFRIPLSIAVNGLPKEIVSSIDKYRMVVDSLNVMYIILETLGVYRKPDMLFSEMNIVGG